MNFIDEQTGKPKELLAALLELLPIHQKSLGVAVILALGLTAASLLLTGVLAKVCICLTVLAGLSVVYKSVELIGIQLLLIPFFCQPRDSE